MTEWSELAINAQFCVAFGGTAGDCAGSPIYMLFLIAPDVIERAAFARAVAG
jgi:hypothetical protein